MGEGKERIKEMKKKSQVLVEATIFPSHVGFMGTCQIQIMKLSMWTIFGRKGPFHPLLGESAWKFLQKQQATGKTLPDKTIVLYTAHHLIVRKLLSGFACEFRSLELLKFFRAEFHEVTSNHIKCQILATLYFP